MVSFLCGAARSKCHTSIAPLIRERIAVLTTAGCAIARVDCAVPNSCGPSVNWRGWRLSRRTTIADMTQSIVQVDAFTAVPFSGSPAAVCILPQRRDAAWMQQVAREMNLSETAFLVRRDDEACAFDLRWFTPTVEVDLCGHATLASAHVLREAAAIGAAETVRFHTRSGVLSAVHDGDWIRLDFPATPDAAVDAPDGLLDALGVSARYVGKSRFDY